MFLSSTSYIKDLRYSSDPRWFLPSIPNFLTNFIRDTFQTNTIFSNISRNFLRIILVLISQEQTLAKISCLETEAALISIEFKKLVLLS